MSRINFKSFLLLYSFYCLILLDQFECRVHEIANFGLEIASLPCEVDLDNCGEIYFITWSKNVSNEWQRVYSYSQGYQKALGSFASEPTRITMDDSNMTTTGTSYLKIKSLKVNDEGTYKCDVTYVHGNCPSLTYSKLFALVKPGEPVIRINGRKLESTLLVDKPRDPSKWILEVDGSETEDDNQFYQVGPFPESSTITLECSTSGGRPMPDVKWWNGSRPLRSKTTVTSAREANGPMVTSTIRFIVSRSDVGARFGCRVWNNATQAPLAKWISLEIHVKPLTLRLRGPKAPVVSGEMVSLSCTVDGARPPATIVWFNRSEVVTPHPQSSTDLMTDGTYRTWSTLVFIASRYDHNGEFFCKGTNQVLKERNEVPLIEVTMLQVLYPPAVSMEPEGKTPVNESSSISLSCSFDANPPNVSEIIWYKDGYPLNAEYAGRKTVDNNGIIRLTVNIKETILTIKNATQNHTGYYSCSLKNSFGTGNSTNQAYIDVWYPPKVTIDLRPSVVIETGKSLLLRCLIIDGNPQVLTKVQWYYNGEHFETTQDTNAFKLTLTNVTSSSAGNYTCRGFNGALSGSPMSPVKSLIVQYKPSQANLSAHYDGEISSKGTLVTLTCSLTGHLGNPTAHSFIWLHQGTLLEGINGNTHRIDSLSVSNQGNYSCAAVNKVGQGPFAHYMLRAKGSPRLIQGLPATIGSLRNQSVTLFCQIECEPLCPIEWFINNESLGSSPVIQQSSEQLVVEAASEGDNSNNINGNNADNSNNNNNNNNNNGEHLIDFDGYYQIRSSLIREDASSNQLNSILSYLYIKNNSWLRDNDIISCKSQTNNLGPPISSNTYYKIEYAPERVKISINQLELLEGDQLAENLIVCSASANPIGHYQWISSTSGQLVSQGPNLYFNNTSKRIYRDLNDNYTCIVTNKHGTGRAHFSLNVLYRPECRVHKESLGGTRWLLSCEASSNPPVLNFTWYRNNRTVGETLSVKSDTALSSASSSSSTSSISSANLPVSSKRLAVQSDDKQSSVLILEESDLDAYSCIATNIIGASAPCKLKETSISAPSGWVQSLLKDENLIIVGTAFGTIVLIIVSSLIIVLIFVGRRKVKALKDKPSNHHNHLHHHLSSHHHHPSHNHHHLHYSNQKFLINQSKTSSLNKIPILEERSIPDGRCSDGNCDGDISGNCSPLNRSPLITRSHQCITLGPMGSPLLLSEYLTDENESETQVTGSPNSMNHYYESTSPLHHNSTNHYTLHHSSHYNIPLNQGPPPPPIPPIPPERTHRHYPNHVIYDFNHHRYHQRIT